ncbi:MAG TPA: YCF48-related protein [Chloroflexota bacterium]|nr:YCF48-related protein [Chloroflexota bacterium]
MGVALALVTAVAIARSRMGAESPAAESPAAVPLSVLRTADFHALAFSPENSDTVFFGHHNGVMRSADGGKTWGAVADRRGFDAMGMAVSRANPNQIFIAGHDVFQVSADGGTTWQPVQHNLPGTDIHGFAMSPDDPNRLYAFVNGMGAFASADAGQAWRRLGQTPADVMGLTAAGGSPETVFVASMGAGILRSADGGDTWQPAAGGSPRRALALAADPSNRQTLYAGNEDGLYKTTGGGANWTRLPFPARNAVAIAVSPSQPGSVLAISQNTQARTGEVFRSDDGGQSWGARR